ncbi:MAG: protein O-mannosyl-transferase family, partial [Rubrobacter sp.]
PEGLVLGVLSVALLLLPLPGVWAKYEENDMSKANLGRERIEAVVNGAARGATVLHHRSELWYMVLVEERRQDLTLVDPFFHNREIGYADIVWPDDIDLATTDRRYGTDDFSGVTAATLAAEKGPVYIMNQEGISGAQPFRDAGFGIVEVEDGRLYELVPPAGEQQAGG